MNKVLWVLQVLLALVFLAHGWLMLAPPANLVDQMNEAIGPRFRVFIGVSEVLAAVGLTLPGVTGILPWLTWLAAAGLMIVMVSATYFHLMRGETSSALICVVLLAFVTLVAYMRWKVLPLASRQAPAIL